MASVIEERWSGIGFDVIQEEIQVADEMGRLQHNPDGTPVKEPHTTLVFLLVGQAGPTRVVKVPFNEESRQQLIAKLTGGIIVPRNGTV